MATAAPERLFARKATGLVREIGVLTAVLICLANTIGLGWQKRVFQFTGPAILPENSYVVPPMVAAFAIGGIIIILSTLSYAVLTAAMPRSGGGYVVISRLVGPLAGFVASWAEFLSIAWSFGIIAVAVFEGIWFIFGPVAGVSAPGGDIELILAGGGLVLVILFTAIAVFGVRLAGALLHVMFWVPAVLTFYVLYLLASGAANPSLVATGIRSITGASADAYVSAALKQGMAGSFKGGYGDAIGVASLGAYWAYIGYAAATFVAGEVKEANRKMPVILIIAGIVIVVTYVTVSTLAFKALSGVGVTRVGGDTYSLFSAYSYLSYGGGSLKDVSGITSPIKAWTTSVAGFTGNGLGLQGLNFLLIIFGAFWIANDIPPFILTASRVVFAMSFDRVFPMSFSNVSERFHSPVNATIFTGLVGLLGVVSESGVQGRLKNPLLDNIFGVGVGTTDLLDGIFFTVFALALLAFPFKRKEIYDAAPFKPGGVGGLVVLGLLALIGNLYLDYVFLFSPRGGFNLGALPTSKDAFTDGFALWFTIGLLAIGAIVYGYYKTRAKVTGVDYTTIFASIPPE